jgi:hypothetical protein
MIHPSSCAAAIKLSALALAAAFWITGASAQQLPGVGGSSAPTAPGIAAPGIGKPSPATPESSGATGSVLGGGQSPDKVQDLKTELECKNPANAAKPECVKRMLTK